jgi:hypothetical protein
MGIFGQSQPGQPRYSGELHNLQVTESVYGTCAPILFGTSRLHQKLLFYGGFYSVKAPNSSGKGIFGGKATEWDYYADVLMLLCQGANNQACIGIANVWDQQGKLQNQGYNFAYTIPSSSPTVIPSASPTVGTDLGVYKTVPYSVVANDYGAGGSITLTGNQNVKLTKVASAPGSGQYSFNPATGAYTFSTVDNGTTVYVSYSSVFSLYYFQQTQAAVIPGSPYKVSTDNQTYFYHDNGVTRVDTGVALTYGSDYTQSSGVYTFNSSLAGIYVYIDYTYTSSDSDVTNTSSLNLTFFPGIKGQSPWSYMTSKYPGSAFGYSGFCYLGANPLFLGQSASMPSYNYETVGLAVWGGGILDAHPCDAFNLLLTDPLLGVGFPSANIDPWVSCYAYWASNNYFISVSLDTQQPASDALKTVIETGNVAVVWSGGLLKLIPYGDATTVGNGYTYTPNTTPAFTLTWDNLLSPSDKKTGDAASDDPLQVSVRAPQDCMNYVQCQWTNRTNDYNNELTPEQNDAFIKLYGFRPESPQTWEFITTQTAATWALNLRLKRNCYIRNTYKFWLPFWFCALEPMDMVVLPTGEPVRITSIEDDASGRLAIEAEQWTYGSADVTIYPKQAPSSYQPTASQAIPGNTYPVIFEATPQSLLAQPNTIQFAVAGNQAAWGGCFIYASPDGTTWTQIDKVESQGRSGYLSAVLANHADPDNTNTLAVDMTISGGELVSVTASQMNAFATLSAIVDQSGSIELIAYETVSLTAQNRYSITSLRRGVYGTTIGAHAIGAEFSYIGATGIFNYQYPAQYAGKLLYFKFSSFNTQGNQAQDLSQCKEYQFTIPGTSIQPPSSGTFSTVPTSVLTGQGLSGGSGQILIDPFVASLNNQSVSCTPASPITGLTQNQSYFVYYVDLAFQGGNITPIATQNQNDFLSKTGYYSLGSVLIPLNGSIAYRPSSYIDQGDNTTQNPTYAYDASPSSYAQVKGTYPSGGFGPLTGDCIWQGFPSVVISGSKTLYVTAAVTLANATNPSTITATISGVPTVMLTATSPVVQTTYTITVPTSTNISSVSIEAIAGPPASSGLTVDLVKVYDIYIA